MTTLAEVLERHGPALARVVALYARPGADRDDLSQEIVVQLLHALPRFRGESSLLTYVLRIAHVQGLRRSWKRERFVSSDLDALPSGEADDEETMVRTLDRERLLEAVRELALPWRQVMALQLEGLSHRAIGEVLGLTENAVAVRLHRARQALREKLRSRDG